MIDVTENNLLAFGSEVGKLPKTHSNYCHGLYIRKRPRKYGMKNISHGRTGQRHYFLKQYKDIKLINPICAMLHNKKNIFIGFLLHFNANRFYEQTFVNALWQNKIIQIIDRTLRKVLGRSWSYFFCSSWRKLFVGIRGDKDFNSNISGRPQIRHEFRFEFHQYQLIYFHNN
jgi:hypothetical protein